MIEKIVVKKLQKGIVVEKEDLVIKETSIKIYVNGDFLTQTVCINKDLNEMAVGHLLAAGKTFSANEYTQKEGSIHLTIEEKPSKEAEDIQVLGETIMLASEDNLNRSQLFKDTGMIHSCSIYKGSKLVSFGEDLGRHNAIDKALGKAFLQGENLKDCFMFTSGRMPLDIVTKGINAGIKLIVSRSAPTWQAMKLGEERGITLVGFARGEGFNIYTGEERIKVK